MSEFAGIPFASSPEAPGRAATVTDRTLVPFDQLGDADLVVDAVYLAGPTNNTGADPLARLLPTTAFNHRRGMGTDLLRGWVPI